MSRSGTPRERSPHRRGAGTTMLLAVAATAMAVAGTGGRVCAVSADQWNGTNAALTAPDGPEVDAMVSIGTDLYVSGIFDSAGGVTVSNIARFDGQLWWPLGDPTTDGPVDMPVWSLLAVGTDLYAGVDGAVWQYDTLTSTWTDLEAHPDMSVSALAWYDDGTNPAYLVAGGFSMSGNACYVQAFIDGLWSSLPSITYDTGTPGNGGWNSCYIDSLASMGGDLYVGGVFESAGGVPAHSLAKYDGTSFSAVGSGGGNGVLSSADPIDAAPVGDVAAMAVSPDGTTLVIAGGFSYINGVVDATDPSAQTGSGDAATNLAAWDGTTLSAYGGSDDPATFATPDESIGALQFATDGSLYAGGAITFADGGFGVGRLADPTGSSWSSLGYGTDDVVWALAQFGDSIWAGGWFTTTYSDDAPTPVSGTDTIARWGVPYIAPQVTVSGISGQPVVGNPLTLNLTVTGSPAPTITRQWLRCTAPVALSAAPRMATPERLLPDGCTEIAGATGTTYTVQPADVGFYLVVLVQARNSSGFALDFPATPVKATAAPAPVPSTTAPGGGLLPATGSHDTPLAWVALALVTGGAALLALRRRAV